MVKELFYFPVEQNKSKIASTKYKYIYIFVYIELGWSPLLLNCLWDQLKKTFFLTQKLKPLTWFRFIDDFFFIWQHGIDSLKPFLESLSSFSGLNLFGTFMQK